MTATKKEIEELEAYMIWCKYWNEAAEHQYWNEQQEEEKNDNG